MPDHTDLMVEAYCGIGAISLFAADKAKEIIGIESVEDAVANASENALLNGKENLSFVCQDAATELKRISQKRHVDTLVVDPPRSGLDRTMKDAILKAQPQNLIYVSCNPSTLGKDLDVLQKKYAIECVQPFDFFSQTPHVETAVKLSLKNKIPNGIDRSSFHSLQTLLLLLFVLSLRSVACQTMETLKIRTGGIDSQNKILMPLDDFQMHEDFL
ncbi:class I SAM-dependent RNA methyltransferase [Allobaculum sp. Allo2]|uniref:class I SAM-dependent RNA methyltransferase n=1 Tax=Allobaculum sp. Allo2 TaxID=2853432 RepID=UPI001F61E5B9|nr:methyltransferase domain-containing protein [Allobaculum sp. Allo2]